MAAENRRTKATEMEPPVQALSQHPCPELLAQELLAADERRISCRSSRTNLF